MADPNPNPPAVSYQNTPGNLAFYNPNPIPAISAANPSSPTPMQGECFCNCPLVAAMDAVTWVNRKFIANNTAPPDINGNTTFYFWDYGSQNPMIPNNLMGAPVIINGQINVVPLPPPPQVPPAAYPVKTKVTVSNQVLLDGAGRFSDPGYTSYGASSTNANESWPALLERAYAKFCYYENGLNLTTGPLACTYGVDANGNPLKTITGPDPAFADLAAMTAAPPVNYWGGNAAIALAYLIGKPCFQLSTVPVSINNNPPTYNVPTSSSIPTNVNSGSLYSFIKGAFCSSNAGIRKTRYPVVAWTYANGSQLNGVAFSNLPSQGIMASHCYAVLGTFDATNGCTNGHSYIVLRTTFGLSDPLNLAGVAPSTWGLWQYRDTGFPIGGTGMSVAINIPNQFNLSIITDGIFGLDATVFSNYFQALGWCEC